MATPITLAPGGNLGAVDIPLAAGKVRARHIRGRVVNGATGGPAAGANVRLIPRTYSAHMIVPQTITDAAGAFDLSGVVPGNYSLYVLGANVQQRAPQPGVPPPPAIPLMTMTHIEISNDDVDSVTLSIVQGSTITGRVSIEGRPANDPDLARIRVNLEGVPTAVAMVQGVGSQVTADGLINIPNVWPANYRTLAVGIPPNTYVKSMRLGQLDLLSGTMKVPVQTEGQIEIVVAADPGSIEGRVLNERNAPSTNAKVALVPDAPLRGRLDLYKSGATDLSGTFRFSGVPPGDYKVFSWEEAEDGAWMDPEFLRNDETRGVSVRVASSRKENVTAMVIPGKR